MPEYNWPSREASTVIGTSPDRLDGTVKATGAAKYTYDINLKNQLIAVAFGSPFAHCKIKNLDTTAAQKSPGVVHVEVLPQGQKGTEIEWEGELLAVVAAESVHACKLQRVVGRRQHPRLFFEGYYFAALAEEPRSVHIGVVGSQSCQFLLCRPQEIIVL